MRDPHKYDWADQYRDEEPYHPIVCLLVQAFLMGAVWVAIILGAQWLFS